MKRLLVAGVIIILLLVGSAYLFFPREMNVTNIERINIGVNSISRFVMDGEKWPKWWPGKVTRDSASGSDLFSFDGYSYQITGYKYNAISVRTLAKGYDIDGIILLIPINGDSVQAEWRYSLETNANPINRIELFLESRRANRNIATILNKMKRFMEKPENVYGMRVDQVQVKDTLLVATKISTTEYPSTSRVYSLIEGLKNYISKNKAVETSFPMLHVWEDSGLFHTTVAIPVDRKIPENESYSMKRMVPGKILVSEVTGGPYRAREALRQLGLFVADNNLTSPAIPFESLVTNRMQEADTTKWITKVYFPVM
jgi:effector-binding domain-containing protein